MGKASKGSDLPSNKSKDGAQARAAKQQREARTAIVARSCFYCHKDCGSSAGATACEQAHEAENQGHGHP